MNEEDWFFQERVPVCHAVFEVDLPHGWNYYSAWLHYEPSPATESTPGHHRWELYNVPAIDMEDVSFAPASISLVGRMTLHYGPTDLPPASERWASVGVWFEQLASPRATVTPEIAAKSQELIAGQNSFTGRLQAITQYLQANIRYVGIEIGIGGWQPHSAAEVFHNRYGDCKDKATLLKTMLESVGVHATWVMVDTRRGGVDPAFPSIYGNHMIAAIEVPAGEKDPLLQALVTSNQGKRYLIFDPTDEYTPVGEIRPQLQGSYGVLVEGEHSEIIQLPELSPATNVLDRTAKFELESDGSLKGTVTEDRSGSEAWRSRALYTESSPKDQKEAMERRLREDFSNFTLDSAQAENASRLDKQFVLHYAITAPQYARFAGNLLLVRPRVLGSMSLPLDEKPRIYRIELPAMRTERDSFNLQLPPGYAVDETPDPVKLDTNFGSYRSQVKVDGNVLHYSRELVLSRLELQPDEYPQLKKFMGEIQADEQGIVVLKKQ